LVTYKKQLPFVVVDGIVRANANPACGNSVNFTVTFSEEVFNVDTSDFLLATSGVTGASVTSVTEVGPNGDTYTVTVNTGTGSGSIGLNLADNDSIFDIDATPLGGTGAGNGNFTGQVYMITKDPLTITCPGTQTANAAPDNVPLRSTYPPATSSGGCGSSTISYVLTGATTGSGAGTGSGLTFNKGVTTVTLTATDSLNATAQCTFTVTINDNEPPAIACRTSPSR